MSPIGRFATFSTTNIRKIVVSAKKTHVINAYPSAPAENVCATHFASYPPETIPTFCRIRHPHARSPFWEFHIFLTSFDIVTGEYEARGLKTGELPDLTDPDVAAAFFSPVETDEFVPFKPESPGEMKSNTSEATPHGTASSPIFRNTRYVIFH